MSEYDKLVIANKDNLKIQVMKIIDNKSLLITYSIKTNLNVDFGICDEMFSAFHSNSKGRFNKRISKYQNLTGRKIKLTGTDNSLGYTRLIYSI